MSEITKYHVEALINGSVSITPGLLTMRFNDEKTPCLDVWASYVTAEGKKRPFVLTDVKILFEVVTPGGAAGVISSESSSCFEVINLAQGHFLFTLPSECKDAVGSSKLAYFRFITDETVFSTGNFSYTVSKDIYSVPAGDLKLPVNFNLELQALQSDFSHVKTSAEDAGSKVGSAWQAALEAQKAATVKQDMVPDATDDNIASWKDGATEDSGIKSADIRKTINTRHYHKNKGALNKLSQTDGRVSYEGHEIAYLSDLHDAMPFRMRVGERSYKYGFTLNEAGGLRVVYEEVCDGVY